MARKGLMKLCDLMDNEDIPLEQQFLGDLKQSIEITASKERREPSKTYKPSSMTCIRNMYFQVTGQKQDEGYTPYTLVGICNCGTDIHERIQSYVEGMAKNGFDCEWVDVEEYIKSRKLDSIEIVGKQGMETKLYHKTYNMSFLCDGIIKYKGKYYIVEFKTESSYKWQSRKGVDPKHYAQGISYSVAFGIDKVLFVYINRDIFDLKTYMFEPSVEDKRGWVNKIFTCDGYIESGEVPPKPDNLPRSVCEYCGYRTACRELDKQ